MGYVIVSSQGGLVPRAGKDDYFDYLCDVKCCHMMSYQISYVTRFFLATGLWTFLALSFVGDQHVFG